MRYKKKRSLINWAQNDRLKIAKQLAGAIMASEAVNKVSLFTVRFPAIYPFVTERILGVKTTFEELRRETFETQGKHISPNRLHGRGDVVNREGYKEVDEFTASVFQAYMECVGLPTEPVSRRAFTDDQVRAAVIRQRKKCANPTCRAPFSGLNPPVGDHANPWCYSKDSSDENCLALCSTCNSKKGALDFATFVAKCAMVNSNGRIRLGVEAGMNQ